MTATGQDKIKKGFDPLMPGFKHVPFNDLDALKGAVTEKTAAILIEPIQGEGGVVCPDSDYFPALRAFCDANDVLLIFDEIQTGMGRTGKLFCYEHYGITPDIMTLAKGLAGGLPIGAVLARDELARSLGPGTHATTFGGNPLVTAAGIAAIQAINDPSLLENCRLMGAYLVQELYQLREKHAVIQSIRGKGLLIGAELSVPGADIVKRCMDRGVLINCVQDTVLRFIPPLIVTKEEIDRVVATVDKVLTETGQLS